MPDITQRIADILDKHTPSGAEGCVTCWCSPTKLNSFGQHSAHVAQVLINELGLSLELTTRRPVYPGDVQQSFRRYVTDWVPDA